MDLRNKRFTNWIYAGTSGLLLTWGMGATAAPTYYPDRAGALQDVKNNTRATVLADTQDPKKAYVVPPSSGEAKPQNFQARSANLGFCAEMADLQGYSRRLAEAIAAKDDQISQMTPELDRLRDVASAAAQDLAKVVASTDTLRQLDTMQNRVADIEARLNTLYDRLQNCTGAACDDIDQEVQSLQKEKSGLTQNLVDLRAKAGKDLQRYQRAKAAADAAKSDYDNGLTNLETISDALIKARSELFSMYQSFAKLEGGFADINYDTGWDAATATLRTDNPGYEFAEIPTHAAKIYANFVGSASKDSYLASLPMVLDYSVNGQPVDPGAVTNDLLLASLPSQMQASLRLSLVGACPLNKPEAFDLKKEETGVPVFAISAAYDIPVAFRTKVKFSYNLYQMYQQIKQSGTDSGFFSSSSWSNVTENRVSHDAFEADWQESDPDNALTDDQKHAVETEVKQELIARVLKQMAVPVVDGAPQLAGVPAVPPSGAIVIAQGLEQGCGYYSFYCVAGGWVLRGLNAIFGSSSVEQSYKSTADKTATETWDRTTVRWKPAVTVMTRQDG